MITWEMNKEHTWLQYGVCASPQSPAKVMQEQMSATFPLTRCSDENPNMLSHTATNFTKSSSAI